MIYHTGCGALMATAVLLASAPTYAQTPREQLNPVDVYLQQKSQEFQASQRAADARNAGTTVTALYNLLRDKGPFASAPVVGRTSDRRTRSLHQLLVWSDYCSCPPNMAHSEGLLGGEATPDRWRRYSPPTRFKTEPSFRRLPISKARRFRLLPWIHSSASIRACSTRADRNRRR